MVPYIACHVIRYAVDLDGLSPDLREGFLAVKAQEEMEELLAPGWFRDFDPQLLDADPKMRTRWLNVVPESGPDILFDTLKIATQARHRFESAVNYTFNNNRIWPEQGMVFLPSTYVTHMNKDYLKELDQWYARRHIGLVCLRMAQEGHLPNWRSYSSPAPYDDKIFIYKISIWSGGHLIPISDQGQTHYFCAERLAISNTMANWPIQDAHINPAKMPGMQGTPCLGVIPPAPFQTPGLY